MSDSPILHHQALGVHPGAFVQSTTPDISQIQDGCLWVDTSTPAPYQLYVWRFARNAWESVGIVVPPASGAAGDTLTLTSTGLTITPTWQASCCEVAIPPMPTTGLTDGGVTEGTQAQRTTAACGAALALATGIEAVYKNVATWANWAITTGINRLSTLAINALIAAVTDGFGLALDAFDQAAITVLVSAIQRGLSVSLLTPLSTMAKDEIAKSIYLALPVNVTTFQVDAAMLQAWKKNLSTYGVDMNASQLFVVQWLIGVPTLASWNYLAAAGAQQPSTVCKSYLRATGASMTGGAHIGVPGKALTGGGQLTVTTGRSVRGGAALAGQVALSMTGGAHL